MSLMRMNVEHWHDEVYRQRMAERYTACLRGLITARTVGEAVPEVPQCDKFP